MPTHTLPPISSPLAPPARRVLAQLNGTLAPQNGPSAAKKSARRRRVETPLRIDLLKTEQAASFSALTSLPRSLHLPAPSAQQWQEISRFGQTVGFPAVDPTDPLTAHQVAAQHPAMQPLDLALTHRARPQLRPLTPPSYLDIVAREDDLCRGQLGAKLQSMQEPGHFALLQMLVYVLDTRRPVPGRAFAIYGSAPSQRDVQVHATAQRFGMIVLPGQSPTTLALMRLKTFGADSTTEAFAHHKKDVVTRYQLIETADLMASWP